MITSFTCLLNIVLSILCSSPSPVSAQSGDTHGIDSQSVIGDHLQSLRINASNTTIHLYQTGQCPTSPKPVCSDANCEGPYWVDPMQYRCKATTAFKQNGRDITLTGCRCCPLPIYVRCARHDCRAPAGTRQCASEELGGCTCETDEDRIERFHRNFRVEDIPVLAEGEVEEDLIEVDDDDNLDSNAGTRTETVAATSCPPPYFLTLQQHTRHTGVMALPKLGLDQRQYQVMRHSG